MFSRILVALDNSAYARTAGEYALALAAEFDSHVVALHVIDVRIVEGPTLETLAPLWGDLQGSTFEMEALRALRERAEETLSDFAEQASDRGLTVETRDELGLPGELLVEHAASCELLVIGRRGEHSSFGDDPLGSTARAVLRKISRPVMATPAELREIDRILAAYDGSDAAVHALDLASRYAEAHGSELEVVHVAQDGASDPVLERAAKYLASRKVDWRTHAASGDPADAVPTAFDELGASCLFMGAYSGSRLHDWLLGSDTEKILARIDAPAFLTR